MDQIDHNNIKWILGQRSLPTRAESTDITLMGPELWGRFGTDSREIDTRLKLNNEGLDCKRLGHYYEALVKKLARDAPFVEQSLFNKQIFCGNDTLGEADLIAKLQGEQRPIHVEMALKFYLHDPTLGDSSSSLVGPNPRDNLAKKWRYLAKHQLALSELDQYKATAPNWAQNPERLALLQGRVFASLDDPDDFSADSFSTESLSGKWIHHRDDRIADMTDSESLILTDRRLWISDPPAPQNNQISSRQKFKLINEHFEQTNFALMLFNFNKKLPRRIMIVPEGWPNMKPPIRPIYESRNKGQ